MDVRMPDGTIISNVPDGITQSELLDGYARLNKQQAQPSQSESYLSNPLVRMAKGLKDPIDAGAQMLPRALNTILRRGIPQEHDLGGPTQAVSNWLSGEAKSVDADIASSEKEYRAAQAKAKTGMDAMRFAGNVLSPANVLPAKMIPAGALSGLGQAAKTGAIAGGSGSAMQPITDARDQESFGTAKAVQTGGGVAAGAVLGPVTAKLAEVIVPRVTKLFGKVPAERLSDKEIELGIRSALDGAKIESKTLPPEVFESLKAQVRQGLATGRQIDVPAAARQADAQSLGIDLTLGQSTRDPLQFAREQNLRGVENVGEPLMLRFQDQGTKLRGGLGKITGPGSDPYRAGETIKGALRSADEEMASKADLLYQSFREMAPNVQSQNPQAWASKVMDRLEGEMVGGALPADYISRLNKISTGKFPLTPSTLHEMYRNANRDLKGAQGASKHAIGLFKSALDDEMMALAESAARKPAAPGSMVREGVIAPEVANSDSLRAVQALKLGRKQVAERYGQQEAMPAMRAALDDVSGEAFVKQQIIGGKTSDVFRLGSMLKQTNPEAFVEARSQIGSALQRAAFGEDAAGSAGFRPDEFAKALRTFGREKLLAFYSPDELKTLETIGRVGANVYAHPDRAPVNHSNNAAWAMSILEKLPLGGMTLSLGRAALDAATRGQAVKGALAAEVPSKLAPEIEAEVSRYLTPALVGGGVGLGAMFR